MGTLHRLEYRQRSDDTPPLDVASKTDVLVAFPRIDLDTVLGTMSMLRRHPDQTLLDNFNRADSRQRAAE